MKRIILFDGVCNFCSSSVQFIIQRDPDRKLHFASLQSEVGQELVQKYHVPEDIDSLILIDNDQVYTKSTAALNIAKQLSGVYRFARIFLIIPKPIRDFLYQIIAKNRYKWFGKKEACMIPKPEDRQRFID
ncbi:thiol-disulfide oxidoreductase DCC family protein [Gracilibacillus caseinilyticus]|uniref:Thiol-disulfide oxidoreductase DCC family protein n=1 Tax=Gracilibacillus caseinilyticus TaxID=2932256 RepID=A0ABY4EXR3_9BACI|nr:thiol-disulfide oxidoreductase DCC family protein [Gracilibacillus caseinilyticus]UOQ46946.1 thiol-disulfide oxidoreductase DCC family protein [Gracilibacillus caseinilyticus]